MWTFHLYIIAKKNLRYKCSLACSAMLMVAISCGKSPSNNTPTLPLSVPTTSTENASATTTDEDDDEKKTAKDIELVDTQDMSEEVLALNLKKLQDLYTNEKKKFRRLDLTHEKLCDAVLSLRQNCTIVAPLSSAFLKDASCKRKSEIIRHNLHGSVARSQREWTLLVNNKYRSTQFKSSGAPLDFPDKVQLRLQDITSLHLVPATGGTLQASDVANMTFQLTFNGASVISSPQLSLDDGKIQVTLDSFNEKKKSSHCNPSIKSIMSGIEEAVNEEIANQEKDSTNTTP
ncbi:MAG: hypothetical protein OXC44_08420 [Proteobacteria bacterium]|nr:hypothetical protein [Pseudomonadota bacterium]